MNRNIIELAEHYVGLRVNNDRTASCYLGAARSLLRHVPHNSVAELTTDDLLQWKKAVLTTALPSTLASYLHHLRTIGTHGVKYKMMDTNIFQELKAPPFKRLPKLIADEDFQSALELVKSDELPPGWFWHIVLEVFSAIAIRQRQAIELRWEDIAFERRMIRLNWQGSKTKQEVDLPLTDGVVDLFRNLKSRTEAIHSIKPSDQVFNVTLFNCRYVGNRMKVEQLSGFFKRLSNKLGGGRVTSHRIRHTRATQLGSMPDANLFALQQLLGHTDIRMTREYVAVDTNAVRQLLENAEKNTAKTKRSGH